MAHFYLRPGKRVASICSRKHRKAVCKRPHSIADLPKDVIWHGEWPIGLEGELVVALRAQLREHKNAVKRWLATRGNLAETKGAPAMAHYLAKLRASHELLKPVFKFVAPRCG